MNELIKMLDEWFGKKAPQLPAGVKEFIVKVAPYLIIIGLIISAVALLTIIPLLMGTSALLSAVGYVAPSMNNVWISLVALIIIAILELMALPGLFKRTSKSWNLVFYAELVSLLQTIVSFNIVGFIISALIGFYILFQIRPFYFGGVSMMTPPPPQVPKV